MRSSTLEVIAQDSEIEKPKGKRSITTIEPRQLENKTCRRLRKTQKKDELDKERIESNDLR